MKNLSKIEIKKLEIFLIRTIWTNEISLNKLPYQVNIKRCILPHISILKFHFGLVFLSSILHGGWFGTA